MIFSAMQPEEDSAIGSSSVTSTATDASTSEREPLRHGPTSPDVMPTSASTSSFIGADSRAKSTADWLDKGEPLRTKGYIKATVIQHDPSAGHYVIRPIPPAGRRLRDVRTMPPMTPTTSPASAGDLVDNDVGNGGRLDADKCAPIPGVHVHQGASDAPPSILDPLIVPRPPRSSVPFSTIPKSPSSPSSSSHKKQRLKTFLPGLNNNAMSSSSPKPNVDQSGVIGRLGQQNIELLTMRPVSGRQSINNYSSNPSRNVNPSMPNGGIHPVSNDSCKILDDYCVPNGPASAQQQHGITTRLPLDHRGPNYHPVHDYNDTTTDDCSLTVGLVGGGGRSVKHKTLKGAKYSLSSSTTAESSTISSIFCSSLPCWLLMVMFLGMALLFSAAFVGFCSGRVFCSKKPGTNDESPLAQRHNKLAHTTDPLRLDITVPPGDQHYYLRATSPQERQAWLQHLGTVKACAHSSSGDVLNDNSLRKKYCELRVYCDLLMQQVHSIKSIVTDSPIPNVQKLDETTALLSETCDTFIHTLEDCLHLASPGQMSPTGSTGSHKKSQDSTFPKLHSPNQNSSSAGLLGFEADVLTKMANVSNNNHNRNPNSTKGATSGAPLSPSLLGNESATLAGPLLSGGTSSNLPNRPGKEAVDGGSAVANGHHEPLLKMGTQPTMAVARSEPSGGTSPPTSSLSTTVRYETFFSSDEVTFATVMLEPDGGLPSHTFLDACRHLIKIFDSLGSAAFAPVKMDLNGNIRKLALKYDTDPENFRTMQMLVTSEIRSGTTERHGSATDALLWLKRGIWFVREFLVCFAANDRELADCASEAYSRTLRPFHGWVVRGMFSLASSAVPSRATFISSLANVDPETETSPAFKEQVSLDLTAYLAGLDRTLKTLNKFYKEHDLDPGLASGSAESGAGMGSFFD